MKAFISYSINDSEQYVLVLLSEKLREKGFSLISNHDHGTGRIDPFTAMRIGGSSLFIGVITANGLNHGKVVGEHYMAVSKNIPALLLLEDTAQLSPDFMDSNVVVFNRQNPHEAIEHIHQNIRQVGKPVNGRPSSNTAAAWILGGLVLAGLVSLLSSSKS